MLLDIQPNELKFSGQSPWFPQALLISLGPFTHEQTQVIKLENLSDDLVLFKVKTTAPKQYCVRPNSGKIAPRSAVEVQVLLQPLKDFTIGYKCKDKFLVQSGPVRSFDDSTTFNATWSVLERESKSSIEERKIRVVFEEDHAIETSSEPLGDLLTGKPIQSLLESQRNTSPDSVAAIDVLRHQKQAIPTLESPPRITGVPVHSQADLVAKHGLKDSWEIIREHLFAIFGHEQFTNTPNVA